MLLGQMMQRLSKVLDDAGRAADRLIRGARPGRMVEDVRAAAPTLVRTYANAAGVLAALEYDDVREREGLTGYRALPAVTVDASHVQAVSVLAVVQHTSLDEMSKAFVVEVEKFVADAHRDTTMWNVRRDPAAVGWRRIARPNGCQMCRMLADRGAVYKEATATFATHLGCRCTAQAAFGGKEANVMQYVASRRSRTPEQRAELRAYLNEFFPR